MQASSLIFTPAGQEHRATIRDMQRATAQQLLKRKLSTADEHRMAERTQRAEARVVVCSCDDQWIGYFCVEPTADGTLHLLDIFVFPPYRRRGFSRQMLAEVRRVALAEDASTITLVVSSDNPAARALYKSAGFIETAHHRADPVHQLQMTLPL